MFCASRFWEGSILRISRGTSLIPLEQKNGVDLVIENEMIPDIVRSKNRLDSSDFICASRHYALLGFINPHTHIGIHRPKGENKDHGFELTDPLTPHLSVVERLDPMDAVVVFIEDLLSPRSRVETVTIEGKIFYRYS